MDSSHPQEQHAETRLVTSGRDTKAQKGFVNPPVFHGSTVLYPTAEDLHAHRGEFTYGRHGSPTTRAFQDTLMALEGPQCAGVGIVPSGLSAISTTLLSVLKAFVQSFGDTFAYGAWKAEGFQIEGATPFK